MLAAPKKRKYALLAALGRLERPTLSDLHDVTGIPIPTLKRLMIDLRNDFCMQINFIRTGIGGSGYYELLDWGIINRDRFYEAMLKLSK